MGAEEQLLSPGKLGKKSSFIILPGWHCLGGTRGDVDTPSGKKNGEGNEKLTSPADLHGLLNG